MESTALQQAFDTCQNNKAAWLQRKNELAAAEQEYLRLLSGEGRNVSRLDELRNIIEVRKWQVNQAAGRYIRSHEAVQHISIRDRLNDFMQQHGTALAAALAPELMGYSELTAIARNCAIQRATDALREALLSWLAKGEKINYSAQDSDILTTIGFRPDAASVDDSREKFTPAQNMIFRVKVRNWHHVSLCKTPRKSARFTEKSHASIRCMALHAFSCLIFCKPRHSRRGLSVSVQLH